MGITSRMSGVNASRGMGVRSRIKTRQRQTWPLGPRTIVSGTYERQNLTVSQAREFQSAQKAGNSRRASRACFSAQTSRLSKYGTKGAPHRDPRNYLGSCTPFFNWFCHRSATDLRETHESWPEVWWRWHEEDRVNMRSRELRCRFQVESLIRSDEETKSVE